MRTCFKIKLSIYKEIKMIGEILRCYSAYKYKIYQIFKEGAWIILGQIMAITGSLVMVRTLTEYLDPAEYGRLALALTLVSLVSEVIMGGIVNSIARFYSIANEKRQLAPYLKAGLLLVMIATTVIVAIFLIFVGGLVAVGNQNLIGLAVAVTLFSILSNYSNCLSGIQNAARQRAVVALHGGIDSWLRIALAIGFIAWMGGDSAAVVTGYSISVLLITLSQALYLKRMILSSHEIYKKILRTLLGLGICGTSHGHFRLGASLHGLSKLQIVGF